MNRVYTLVGMAIAPAAAYYLRDKGALIAIGAGLTIGWVINEYVLPSVIQAVEGASSGAA